MSDGGAVPGTFDGDGAKPEGDAGPGDVPVEVPTREECESARLGDLPFNPRGGGSEGPAGGTQAHGERGPVASREAHAPDRRLRRRLRHGLQ